jgi:hypothetical protein
MATSAFTIPSAEEIAEHVPVFRRSTAVFLSGSLVAGFGHANSDVDVYVVFATAAEIAKAAADAKAAVGPEGGAVAGFYVGDVRWDMELVAAPDVETLLGRVEDVDEVDQFPISDGEIDLLYRISVGAAIRGVELVEAWQERLGASRFGEILVSRYLELADGFAEDAIGLLDVADVHTGPQRPILSGFQMASRATSPRAGRQRNGRGLPRDRRDA